MAITNFVPGSKCPRCNGAGKVIVFETPDLRYQGNKQFDPNDSIATSVGTCPECHGCGQNKEVVS